MRLDFFYLLRYYLSYQQKNTLDAEFYGIAEYKIEPQCLGVLLPIHRGVFDLAMHPYYESINRICDLAQKYKVPLLLPAMGERKRLP